MNTAKDIRLSRYQRFGDLATQLSEQLQAPEPFIEGKLVRLSGMRLEVSGLAAGIGSRCFIETGHRKGVTAEVVGFEGDRLILMAESTATGVTPGAKVTLLGQSEQIVVGDQLLGRIIDGAGRPLDGFEDIVGATAALRGDAINPMERQNITEPLDVGVRAINSLLTVGKGQRMGIFAGSGVGKSTLMGQVTRGTTADVIVVCLVGERGREVREFLEEVLGDEGRARSVCVVATSDRPPIERWMAPFVATTIAEEYRDQGLDVLLLMDPVTRFAAASREIGLAAGERVARLGDRRVGAVVVREGAAVELRGRGHLRVGRGRVQRLHANGVLAQADGVELASRELGPEPGVHRALPSLELERRRLHGRGAARVE